MKKRIPIVFCVDDFYLKVLHVTLQSMMDTMLAETNYEIILLYDKLNPDEMVRIQAYYSCDQMQIRFVCIKDITDTVNFYTGNRSNLTRQAYFRLYLPWVLREYEKVIYLDADIIVCQDLTELYETELSNLLLAAGIDYMGISFCNLGRFGLREYIKKEFGLIPEQYLISGVLVMNLDQFREQMDLSDMTAFIEKKQRRFHDQDILNEIVKGDFIHLSPKWGALPFWTEENALFSVQQKALLHARANPGLIHFAGPYHKPWKKMTREAITYFWPVAEKTAVYKELIQELM